MSGAYRRHQSLVRCVRYLVIVIMPCRKYFACHTRYSTFHFAICIRLEERGWVVSGHHAHPSSSSFPSSASRGDGKGSASVVVAKTGKKGMDYEQYLDATQRYASYLSYVTFLCYSFSQHACVIKGSHQGLERLDVWRSFESEPGSESDDCQSQCQ